MISTGASVHILTRQSEQSTETNKRLFIQIRQREGYLSRTRDFTCGSDLQFKEVPQKSQLDFTNKCAQQIRTKSLTVQNKSYIFPSSALYPKIATVVDMFNALKLSQTCKVHCDFHKEGVKCFSNFMVIQLIYYL